MTPTRIVIQARTTSTRLPAKALLPVGGMASVVLCARRAANSGLHTIVAIPDDARDDALAGELERNAVAFVRGNLDDVLGRYVAATRDLPTGGVVVRLTADNMVPDGPFVQQIIDAFRESGIEYLGTHSPLDGLPYGLSAEVFTVDALRAAARDSHDDRDREHVTPWIRRHCKTALFSGERLGIAKLDHLRCTLDNLADYLRLQRLFSGVDDAVAIAWSELVVRLQALPESPSARVPWVVGAGRVHGRMVLGTVQLGMSYGAANRTGQPTPEAAGEIVQLAVERGITWIDTARAYGDAERRLGESLGGLRDRVAVITKLDLPELSAAQLDRRSVRNAVDASVFASCHSLRTQRLDVLMLHRWAHRHEYAGAVWQRLLELRSEGVIGQLGASLYTPDEAVEAARDSDISCIQIPFNLLDWRWRDARIQQALRARADLLVHARSVLLQGILVGASECWPKIPGIDAQDVLDRLDALVAGLGRADRSDLCLAYVRAHEWISNVVIGVETQEQLLRNVDLFQRPALTMDECSRVERSLPELTDDLLNPSRWPTARSERAIP